jgi:hypothetical protein
MKEAKPVFVITLRSDGSRDQDEAYRYLRAFLKHALRAWRFRCLSIDGPPAADEKNVGPSAELPR